MADGAAAAKAARDDARESYRFVALLLLPTVLLLGAAFVYPMSNVFAQAFYDHGFTGKHFERFLTTPLYPKIWLNTLKVSLCVAALSALCGYPTAYFLARVAPRCRAVLIFLILLPLWVSILVRSYSWMVLLGREGVVNSFLLGTSLIDQPLPMLYTTGAVYIAMVQIMLPIMILSCYAIMIRIEPDLTRAARALGATETKAFWYVFFPQTLGGLRGGTIIVFILSMGYFITPALVGSRKDMMIGTLIVFQIDELANWQFAAAIGLILLIATLAVTALIGLVFRGLNSVLSRMV